MGVKIQPKVLTNTTDLCRKKQWLCTLGKPKRRQPPTYAELKEEALLSTTNSLSFHYFYCKVLKHTQEK